MDTPAAAFNRRLGQAVRDLRTTHGRQQEELAAAARALGLPWVRSTLTAIERGGRQLFVHELVLLPDILRAAGITREDGAPLEIRDLLSDTLISQLRNDLTPHKITPPTGYLGMQGGAPNVAIARIAAEAAVEKAAARFGVPPLALATAAWKAWGHGVQEEREARLRRSEGTSRGYRGHVSRALFQELQPLIAGPKRPAARRARPRRKR